MKRALLALTLLACAAANAQSLDPYAPLKSYAAKVLPRCSNGVLTVEPVQSGPANFAAYVVTLRSDDEYCGTQKYLLHSPRSGQVIVGTVVPLPHDARPAAIRVTEQAGQMLKLKVTTTIAPFPLPDGLKAVSINRETPFGPFAYQGYLDASEQFLIVGFRGNLTTDPAKTIRELLGAAGGAQRGATGAKAQILELSDFQCPTCANAHKKIEPMIQKYLSRLSYTRLDLPLFEHHEWAVPAAMGARAIQRVAPKQYWEYVDYVFKNQEAIGKRAFDQVFQEYLEDHDIDPAPIMKIYSSKAERAALLDQVSRAFTLGVNSTPTFIVNGQIMGFGPEGSFTIAAIQSAINASSAPAKAATKAPKKKTGK
ncbi:MAG TPA: thioredoxin domain-containing protein [Thermoanaerobaculia bacterium]|nr:thioredoxin domain-containing protein [Thermoanaerobaculia bacterium]